MSELTSPEVLRDGIIDALEDLKAHDITTIDVGSLTDVTDYMIVVNGTSNRHVRSLVDHVLEEIKAKGGELIGVEGRNTNEWVLIDFGDVVVHVMQREAREFYELERLWDEMADAETQV